MEVTFGDSSLDELEASDCAKSTYAGGVVKSFRRMMNFIRSANDERDLHSNPGYRFKKLQGARQHQCSFRLNEQFRLVVEIHKGSSKNVIHVVAIEDYH